MLQTILIEATEAFNPERRGIGMQMRAWLEAAPFDEFSDYEFIITYHRLDTVDELRVRGDNVRIQLVQAGTEAAYVNQLYKYEPQVIFFPLASPKYVRKGLTKCVGIDYGMEDFYCRNYTAPHDAAESLRGHEDALQNFAGIVTVSETSQHDLGWFFPEYKDKITVVYPGTVKSKPLSEASTLPSDLENTQYFLLVGYEQKKNIKRIATAFDTFKSQTGSQSKLVTVGKPGYGAKEIDEHIVALPHQQDILQLGYISDAQKQRLLERCHALVALPIYEGFGISALEGLEAGKIVLVSDNGSLKEIVGDAGYLADPFSVESMARQFVQISELSGNPKRKNTVKRLGLFNQTVQSRKLLKYLTRLAQNS
jgi:glycosyltransferase involved in cell wall biosynthesis